jgi:hypothetical protein
MNFPDHYGPFINKLTDRLRKGAQLYEDKAFDRPLLDLLEEIEQEVLDQSAWGYLAYAKIQGLKRLAQKQSECMSAKNGQPGIPDECGCHVRKKDKPG